jgi:hypothetical protein
MVRFARNPSFKGVITSLELEPDIAQVGLDKPED